MAYLYCRGRQHNSREFHDELEAARWYDAKALELLGPAAVLNFPQVLHCRLMSMRTCPSSRASCIQLVTPGMQSPSVKDRASSQVQSVYTRCRPNMYNMSTTEISLLFIMT